MKKDASKYKAVKVDSMKLSEQRQCAKAGMVGSMAGLFYTGFSRSKGARLLHPWLGWAFLGFSIWHHIVSKHQPK
jgi:hypothetical protein